MYDFLQYLNSCSSSIVLKDKCKWQILDEWDNHLVGLNSIEDGCRVPYSTPEPEDTQSINKATHSQSGTNDGSEDCQRQLLSLALPDMNDSVEEDEEEIETLRYCVIDNLHVVIISCEYVV